jgi:hypothetical protein
MSESIGAIRVGSMIKVATALTLGSLAICVSLRLSSGLQPISLIQQLCNLQWSIHIQSFFESV